MSKPILLLSLFLFLTCCDSQENRFCIDGCVKNMPDGDTVTLVRITGATASEEIDHAIIKEGYFHMHGIVGHSEPLYLRYNIAQEHVYSLFFIENGDINVLIDTAGCKIWGTPLNDLRNSIEDSITFHIARLAEIEKLYYSTELDSGQLVRLGVCGLGFQEQLVTYLHGVIKENIHNPLGLYLLAVHTPLFSTRELSNLKGEIQDVIIDSGNVPFYDAVMATVKERTQALPK